MSQYSISDMRELAKLWWREQAMAYSANQALLVKAIEKNGDNIPNEIRPILSDPTRLNPADTVIIWTFPVGDRTVELFKDAVKAQRGVITYADGKLPADMLFVPSTLQVLYTQFDEAVDMESKAGKKALAEATYKPIYELPSFMNAAELTVGCGSKRFIKDFPLSDFDNKRMSEQREASVKFDNSIAFVPNTRWTGDLKIHEEADVPQYLFLRLVFRGAGLQLKPNGN